VLVDPLSTLAEALQCHHESWKLGFWVWKVVPLVIAKQRRAVYVAYGVQTQDYGHSSMQLWRGRVRAAANMRLGDSSPRKKQVSVLLRRFLLGINKASWLWSACPPANLATRVWFSVPLHFSSFLYPRPRH